MPASSLSIGAPSLGDDGATIDSADAFDMSLLCNGGVSPAGPCVALHPSPEMTPKIGTADEQDGTDTSSAASSTSDGQRSSSVARHVELKMRNAELQSSYDLLQHAHRLKEEECDSLREEITAVTEERDAAFSRVQELRKVLRQFKKNATEFSLQRARMRVEVERLQEESDRMKRNYQKTAAERDRLRENVDAFASSLGHLKTMTEQLTKERDELKEKLEGKEGLQKEDPSKQDHLISWIERSFRLPTNLSLQEIDEKTNPPLESSNSGETALSLFSQFTSDGGEDEAREDRRAELSKKQGWLSFRWDRKAETDDNKSNNSPLDGESVEDGGSCNLGSTKDSQDKNTVDPIEMNQAESPNKMSDETSSDEMKVDDAQEHSSTEDISGGEKKVLKEELAKRDLPRAESFCASTLRKKHNSSSDLNSSCGPRSSDISLPARKRNYPCSRSAKENRSVSVRSLFGKESQHIDDKEDDTCIILREGAFESSAAVSSSRGAQLGERRFAMWPFHLGKDHEEETGEAGDADEGDCNAVIQRHPPFAKKERGCQVSGDSGNVWLWGRHGDEQSKGIGRAILRRRSNGDLSLGSTVTTKL